MHLVSQKWIPLWLFGRPFMEPAASACLLLLLQSRIFGLIWFDLDLSAAAAAAGWIAAFYSIFQSSFLLLHTVRSLAGLLAWLGLAWLGSRSCFCYCSSPCLVGFWRGKKGQKIVFGFDRKESQTSPGKSSSYHFLHRYLSRGDLLVRTRT